MLRELQGFSAQKSHLFWQISDRVSWLGLKAEHPNLALHQKFEDYFEQPPINCDMCASVQGACDSAILLLRI